MAAVRNRVSLRETDVIPISQLPPPTTRLCESTHDGFAPDTQSRAARADGGSTEPYASRHTGRGVLTRSVVRIGVLRAAALRRRGGRCRSRARVGKGYPGQIGDDAGCLLADDAGASAEAEAAGLAERGLQRRETAAVLPGQVHTILVQEPDHLDQAPQRGSMRRGPSRAVGSVDVGAGLHQQTDRLDRAGLRLAAPGPVRLAGADIGREEDTRDPPADGG